MTGIELCDELQQEFERVQLRADSVYRVHGGEASRWQDGESLFNYRRRLVDVLNDRGIHANRKRVQRLMRITETQ